VLWGGCCDSQGDALDDTWTWDGTTWTQQSPTASPRAGFLLGAVYDPPRGLVVLFDRRGGGTCTFKTTGGCPTWAWDGTTWCRLATATSPPEPRGGDALTYDAARRAVLLYSANGGTWIGQ
jgi:hypothetical protein